MAWAAWNKLKIINMRGYLSDALKLTVQLVGNKKESPSGAQCKLSAMSAQSPIWSCVRWKLLLYAWSVFGCRISSDLLVTYSWKRMRPLRNFLAAIYDEKTKSAVGCLMEERICWKHVFPLKPPASKCCCVALEILPSNVWAEEISQVAPGLVIKCTLK